MIHLLGPAGRIVEASAGNLKKLQLELGGKGANIVFADADIPAAVRGSAFVIFHNQGQACIAGSRLLLDERIAGEFLDEFLAVAARIRLGHPLDQATQMGPVTSAAHRDRVLSYLKIAVDEGAEVLAGGGPPDDPALAAGFYLRPTVVRAAAGDRVCREEVFGPFVTVLPTVSAVNMNTASAEVIAAIVPGINLSSAQAFVARRQTVFFHNVSDVQLALRGAGVQSVAIDPNEMDVNTNYFLIHGRVQHERAEVDRTTLVYRDALTHTTRIVRVQDQL